MSDDSLEKGFNPGLIMFRQEPPKRGVAYSKREIITDEKINCRLQCSVRHTVAVCTGKSACLHDSIIESMCKVKFSRLSTVIVESFPALP